ncbi:hypothetical protein Glove_269g16 [Diversispora epigaea]|uniref:Uncharacterized protein n=1 Tax=Diversispora epigaea TaxID=1348612 RepID=A0A397I4L7_9GLOM|nr:hypothetical protein Glove_269g16 [Diversispora epigaea]
MTLGNREQYPRKTLIHSQLITFIEICSFSVSFGKVNRQDFKDNKCMMLSLGLVKNYSTIFENGIAARSILEISINFDQGEFPQLSW